MSNELSQSIIVGAVAILSAFIGGIIPNWIQNKNRINEIKREKLEELFIETENWYNSAYSVFYLQFSLVFNGHIDWNTYLDMIVEEDKKGDHKKSTIILYLYFKELEQDFNRVREAVIDVNTFINTDIKKLYLVGQDINSLREKYNKKVAYANKSAEILKEHMQKVAKRLG